MMFSLLQSKYRERVLGLILVSPICKGPTWTEWLYSKVAFLQMALCSSGLHIYQNHMTVVDKLYCQVMSNLLYYYGMCGLVKECLLQRYFSKVDGLF